VKLEARDALCTGCRICENYCSFHHERAIWPRRARIAILAEDDSGPFTVRICHQCEDAPCAAACPTEAIILNVATGAWAVDVGICAACGECVAACPYEAIFMDDDLALALKCDLCGGEPECAALCPTGAVRVTGLGVR
jgi:Fe-S-cluster-containing hydrogenase component 2